MKKLICIGHRGACGYAPENTLQSFQKAIDLNVDMIELDIFKCKSGELVCIHNAKLDKTTNGKGYVVQHPLWKLKLLYAGKRQRIPTLDDALNLINKRASVNIEIKSKNTADKVLKTIDYFVRVKKWRYDQFIVSSFRYDELRQVRKINKNIKIGLLVKYRTHLIKEMVRQVNPYSVHLSLRLAKKKLIDRLHAMKLKVFVWTVNLKKDIKRMKELGVDGIFTDYPDKVKSLELLH